MAVLNKIRQRSVFLILIIALALFSFVLADVIRSGGFSGKDNSIATVNGEEISREEFARQVEAYQQNMRGNISTTQAVNRVWDQELNQIIVEEQVEKLGIRAEQAQVRQMMRAQMSQNPQFTNEAGMFDENRVKEYVASLKQTSPQMYQQWLSYEEGLAESAAQNIYANMIRTGVGATLTEGKQAYQLQNNTMDLRYVQIPFSSIPDDEVEVSKSEIKEYVDNHKAKFETEAARNIQYVIFNEEPSVEDKEESKNSLSALLEDRVEYNSVSKTNDTIAGFNTTSDDQEFVNSNSDLQQPVTFKFKNQLPKEFADDLFNLEKGEVYGPYEENGYWKLSKLVETKEIPDSIKASHILLGFQGAQAGGTRTESAAKQLADSLAGVIKADKSKMAALATEFSDDPSAAQNSGDLGYFRPGMMVPTFDDFVLNNNEGTVGVVETDFGYHVIYIEEQTDREKAVKIATVAREIDATEGTRNKLFNEVTKFEIAAGEGDFTEEAKAADYRIRTVRDVKALDENIPGVGQQRRVVQWAFEDDAKVGDVKRFETPTGYIVAQITAKKNKGLMSPEDASAEVIPILTKQKKAEIIKEKISGTTVDQVAENQNKIVQTANAVNLSSPTLAGAGSEPEVVGAVYALGVGETSKPIVGDKGVYVVELVSKSEAPELDSYKPFAQQETSSRRQMANSRAFEALKAKAEIEDKRAKFY
ncbi:MAG: peptidylprolyl isomerase [Zunongwangia sp.]|uniref:Periplasmic chaperone PpiD n=3 Tax=Zunongwangia profunda TaxID=398743 RepID=D5BFQ5_ZUNPS|nr:peptidylprolyl isomerase [Zunongwangia profunda]ADF50999.1 PpiC-type secreted peptidyl-prolyl cis-trans isomerase [Zunongwangia profunda SM-A87]